MEQSTIYFKAGRYTEPLLQEILKGFDDVALDTIEIDRTIHKANGLASEPVIIAAAITATPILISAITRIIERWMENRKEREAMQLTIEAYKVSREAGDALKEISKKNADVAIAYKLTEYIPSHAAKHPR